MKSAVTPQLERCAWSHISTLRFAFTAQTSCACRSSCSGQTRTATTARCPCCRARPPRCRSWLGSGARRTRRCGAMLTTCRLSPLRCSRTPAAPRRGASCSKSSGAHFVATLTFACRVRTTSCLKVQASAGPSDQEGPCVCRLNLFGRPEASHRRDHVGPLLYGGLAQDDVSKTLSQSKRHELMAAMLRA